MSSCHESDLALLRRTAKCHPHSRLIDHLFSCQSCHQFISSYCISEPSALSMPALHVPGVCSLSPGFLLVAARTFALAVALSASGFFLRHHKQPAVFSKPPIPHLTPSSSRNYSNYGSSPRGPGSRCSALSQCTRTRTRTPAPFLHP